jgi:uncharacterized protein (DUF1697 family)
MASSDRYVALLRGINVGGRNRIRMADLVAGFEAAGFEEVRTYIQSGNVLFGTGSGDRAALIERVEAGLRHRARPLPLRRPLPDAAADVG